MNHQWQSVKDCKQFDYRQIRLLSGEKGKKEEKKKKSKEKKVDKIVESAVTSSVKRTPVAQLVVWRGKNSGRRANEGRKCAAQMRARFEPPLGCSERAWTFTASHLLGFSVDSFVNVLALATPFISYTILNPAISFRECSGRLICVEVSVGFVA